MLVLTTGNVMKRHNLEWRKETKCSIHLLLPSKQAFHWFQWELVQVQLIQFRAVVLNLLAPGLPISQEIYQQGTAINAALTPSPPNFQICRETHMASEAEHHWFREKRVKGLESRKSVTLGKFVLYAHD